MKQRFNFFCILVIIFFLSTAQGLSYVFIDLSLSHMGASPAGIGLNAAMPALGWLAAGPFLPFLQRRFDFSKILTFLLALSLASAVAFRLVPGADAWLALRLVFGSGIGIALRLIEYWINAGSADAHRGRTLGVYSAVYCTGAALGAAALPLTGYQGWAPVLTMAGLLAAGLAAVLAVPAPPPRLQHRPHWSLSLATGPAFPALAGALACGMLESIPYTLMPVQVLRTGGGETLAAWTATAFLLGVLVFPVLAGMLADRIGQSPVLVLCGGVALVIPVLLPPSLPEPPLFLALMFAWGGAGGTIYALTLAVIGARFRDAELSGANALFGVANGAGALAGPILNGTLMEIHPTHGLTATSMLLPLLFLGAMATVPLLWRTKEA
ncbi:MFS family permease [Azospirillum fermentarium]|uniref:MFS transporter n=1 Tax=Azospirillum fermentarium TaxID=1233114 RepID=UPI002226D975|nr:MFS transporter [Azospirillum fermentarium]MCW2248242.1 MFS family permease [Azospirillum fermentarium]